ncbi:unnamed protein product [Hymenolepis diminuta]|uniref:Vesicular, overexpressed in cancer, prosurvival protein 1 n=1 Tax=Hymenolepis diminuta TaxID=6216 RepID=A0A158QE41_HYMDI|nr:unnamed protein product [Hymenolepis diminuta]
MTLSVVAVLAFLVCYRAWIRSKHDKMFSNFKDTTTHAPVETAPVPPAPPPQSEPPPIYNLEYGPTFNSPDSFFNPQSAPHPLGITQLPYYPPLSGYIQENPMTITQPYSCQTERTNAVMAAEFTLPMLGVLENVLHRCMDCLTIKHLSSRLSFGAHKGMFTVMSRSRSVHRCTYLFPLSFLLA